VEAADEYVWIYGETSSWWPTPHKRAAQRTWPEALPGCEEALRWARDPQRAARWSVKQMRQQGTLNNLLENGDFSSAAGPPRKDSDSNVLPEAWSSWQDQGSKGTFAWDPAAGDAEKGAARLQGVHQGCYLQAVEVKPGERYAVEVARRLEGKGDALLTVRWQTAEGRWTAEARDVPIPCSSSRETWGSHFGAVEVPEGAGRLVLLLLVHAQEGDEDRAWFDDAGLYRLE
jgi:hypothetical protein